jgi:hypothetical protein
MSGVPQVLVLAVIAAASFAACPSAAIAGDAEAPPPISADQVRCQALGEGYFAVKGSTTCVRISGYVSAGVGFAAPGRVVAPSGAPSDRHATAFTDSQEGASVEAQFNTELGPGRLYLQVGHDSWNR